MTLAFVCDAIANTDRNKLPNRRHLLTMRMIAILGGNTVEFDATFGFADDFTVREVFTKPFKQGADIHHEMRAISMLMSIALQCGASMEHLAHVMGEDDGQPPRSLLGLLVRTGVHLNATYLAEARQELGDDT
jgi:hypothetical protein